MIRTADQRNAREFLQAEIDKQKQAAAAQQRRERAPENERLSRFWSQQWDDLKDCAKYPAAKDKYFSTAAVSASQDTLSDNMLQSKAFDDFLETAAKQGLTLSDDAQKRLVFYGIVQGRTSGIIFSQVQNWFDAFNRLRELKAFPFADDIRQESRVVPVQKPIDALEMMITETREGRRAAIALTQDRFVGEARPLFNEWIQSLYDHWQFVASDADRKVAGEQAELLGLDLTNRKSYDRLRLHLGKQHFFPLLLTEDEKLTEDLFAFKRDNPQATARDERVFLQQKKNERMG